MYLGFLNLKVWYDFLFLLFVIKNSVYKVFIVFIGNFFDIKVMWVVILNFIFL